MPNTPKIKFYKIYSFLSLHFSGNPCSLASFESGTINNKNSIDFGAYVGGLRNPIRIEFSKWKVCVLYTVEDVMKT